MDTLRKVSAVMPLGVAAGAVLAGTLLQLQQPRLLEPAERQVLLAVACLLCVPLLRWRGGWPRLAGLVALALAALLLTDLRAEVGLRDRLDPALHDRLVQVDGVIIGLPVWREGAWRGQIEVERGGWPGTLTLESAAPTGLILPHRLQVLWGESGGGGPPPRATAPRAGQRWRLALRLRPIDAPAPLHGPDMALRALEEGIGGQGRVVQRRGVAADQPVLLGETGRARIDRWRQDRREHLFTALGERPAAGVIAGLSLGDQSAIEREDWALFRLAGLSHLMAISGLHVTMFAWLAGRLIALLWRRGPWPVLMLMCPVPRAARLGGVLAALGYTLLSGWGVPAQRTVLMLATVALLREGARDWPMPRLLVLVAAVVALVDPWALLQPGFWLSFVAVALLMASDPPGARAGIGAVPSGLQAQWREALRSLLRSQWVATLGLAPWTLLFFQQIPLVGLPANLVAIPLVTLVVTPLALLGLLLEPLWLPAVGAIDLLRALLAPLLAWPGAAWSPAAAPLWAQALGIAAAVLLTLPWPWALRTLAVPMLLPLLWPALARPPPGHFELIVPDVGQGHAVLVRTARHDLLHDTGPLYGRQGEAGDAGERVLLPLLRRLGVRELDHLVLSHRDSDHSGGAASLLAALPVRWMHSSLEPGHVLRGRPTGRDGAAGVPHQPCQAGLRWQRDGVEFEFLHPAAAALERIGPERPRSNALSCVLRVAGGGRVALLTGDIGQEQELMLVLRQPGRLQADVMQVPHHGSASSSSLQFVNSVTPRWAIVQAGRFNPYGHPAAGVVQRLESRGTKVIHANRCGAWHWYGAHASERCEQDERIRYWHLPLPPGDRP
ncbi:MAG: hypothetical protein RL654_175 [Pseudomonadota bacterium]|jgi:competence protein ComEC